MRSRRETERCRWRAIAGCTAAALTLLAGAARGQTTVLLEDFEFASSDAAAAAGVIDITDPHNSPSFYISGADENASPQEPGGLFSIGTDAVYCLNFNYPCEPGTFIGFRLPVDAARFPDQCADRSAHVPLRHTYGDPARPGGAPPDFPLEALELVWDVYGDGGFADGLTGTHLWLRLVDCEGEKYEFINYSEVSLYSEIWTLDVIQGASVARIAEDSLIDVPEGDRLLTEIAAIEVLIQDEDDPPTTFGKWYVDYLRVTEPVDLFGDADHDGDVDLVDYAGFAACLAGPDSPAGLDCVRFDANADGRVDLWDTGAFQAAFGTGR